ncbi:hypothetical protein V5799_021725 [Amblyomma americanum]|uniref:Uncharacterized protein n=1 Tax=Amblyomma americanum TaxID=6943 RepID=A0AAQ4FMI6_AMBAM
MHELDVSLGDSIPDVMTIQDRRPPPIIPDYVVNIFTVAMVLLVSVVLVVIGVYFGQDQHWESTSLFWLFSFLSFTSACSRRASLLLSLPPSFRVFLRAEK